MNYDINYSVCGKTTKLYTTFTNQVCFAELRSPYYSYTKMDKNTENVRIIFHAQIRTDLGITEDIVHKWLSLGRELGFISRYLGKNGYKRFDAFNSYDIEVKNIDTQSLRMRLATLTFVRYLCEGYKAKRIKAFFDIPKLLALPPYTKLQLIESVFIFADPNTFGDSGMGHSLTPSHFESLFTSKTTFFKNMKRLKDGRCTKIHSLWSMMPPDVYNMKPSLLRFAYKYFEYHDFRLQCVSVAAAKKIIKFYYQLDQDTHDKHVRSEAEKALRKFKLPF